MNIKLSLLHQNKLILKRLKEKLYQKDNELEISIFTTKDSFLARHSDDLAIVDYEYYEEFKEENNILFLASSLLAQENVIAYTSTVNDIYQNILNRYASISLKVEKIEKTEGCQIINVVGVRGNVGTTTISKALVSYLSNKHKVLYLSFNPLQESIYPSGELTFSNVIMALKSSYGDLYTKVKAVLNTTNNISYFNVCQDSFDYVTLNNNELDTLLTLLKEKFDFEYIVVDSYLDFKYQLLNHGYLNLFVDVKNSRDKVWELISHWYKDEKTSSLRNAKFILNQTSVELAKNCDVVIENYTHLPENLIESNIIVQLQDKLGIYL